MKHTLGEFWSLVYDHECAAVVVLCQPPANSVSLGSFQLNDHITLQPFQQQYPAFWPERQAKKYGPVFTIEPLSHAHYTNIKTFIFKINKKVSFTQHIIVQQELHFF